MRGDRYKPYKTTGLVKDAPVNPAKCAADVWRTWDHAQCDRKPRPDSLGGEWCATHDPIRVEAKRDAKRLERISGAKRRYRAACDEARAPFIAAAQAAVDAAELAGVSQRDSDIIRGAIMTLAEEATSDVSVPYELRDGY